ncbi:MAG: acyl-CoA dehydrogenase [Alphaproteobacteria bacterium]|nr:acyl-CoA dehydrogenase [Alphaproteobacteria bacterium]
MPSSPPSSPSASTVELPGLLEVCRAGLAAADAYLGLARAAVGGAVVKDGRVDGARLDEHQFAAHGFAWISTYVEALRRLLDWAQRLEQGGRLGEAERLILQATFGEYLAQLQGGIALSQGEIARPADLGLDDAEIRRVLVPVTALIARGNTSAVRERLARLAADGHFGAPAVEDEALELFREQIRRFVESKISPHAHDWHCRDVLIPIEIVEQMAALGVFGLTVPEAQGGLGLGKLAMCVVSEELSRGYIGVGSLGTRSEIAAELIRQSGTPAQKEKYLPLIASGVILPTAVFTEPGAGSDLASIKTRGVRDGGVYRITGAKTWITHAARSDLMTLLVRTEAEPGYRGLSMLLAEKPRGSDADPFPARGMSGSEIEVLGYRGMKEFEIGFDGFEVPVSAVLGGVPGQGFKQLMATFESARIQTASRAVGVAQNALELALSYAGERRQFDKAILGFPRVAGKIGWMVAETMAARQLTYYAARQKDLGRRCDIEAGMAKLLAARVAWANADNGVQIHGGNGYALEYPISRVLCDARILNIFEGAAEIQAQVVARGLLEGRN